MPITALHDNDAGVLEAPGKTLLLEFYADWCPSCRTAAQVLEQFAEEKNNIEVRVVNVEGNPTLTRQYHVTSVPTFVIIRDGKIINRFSGAINQQKLRELTSEKEAVK